MAAKKKRSALQDLEKRLAKVEHHVGRSVHNAVKKAEADFKAAQKQLAKEEKKWERKLKAAVRDAERSAARGARDVGQIIRKGTYADVESLRHGGRKKRASRKRRA